jgi:hypothetical protein
LFMVTYPLDNAIEDYCHQQCRPQVRYRSLCSIYF